MAFDKFRKKTTTKNNGKPRHTGPDTREFVGVVLPNGLLATGSKSSGGTVKITSVDDGVSFKFIGQVLSGLKVVESRTSPF